ncbi:DUF6268 family outer membrane beta-barrel protein [Aquimarina sp. 2201CG5-10]|uniref:DUF6268 family outer membrane beta-barrel protein n=1 Tax=Aquimarina callyspongiae TaxID=3098150 RepID=UPI002AB4FD05|nr:DUF6268 family outer membrane beta-barrel protein [Aquimarina sp. 2201CG5-10]MDY8134123.1 DUF6268 family outer membrane beta-barrel protein [Aquimarina sp. 2201CG5-10]
MNKQNLIVLCIMLGVFCTAKSQDTTLGRIEYTYLPQADSNNEFQRLRVSGNYPIKMDDNGTYFVIGAQYRFNNLKINDDIGIAETGTINNFHTAGLEFGYTFKMKNDWRFGAKLGVRISSDFEASGIDGDDFRYTGSIFFVKSKNKKQEPLNSRWILGLRYTTPASLNFPLPIINYFERFHVNWSYSLGTPKSNIKYFINEKNTVQAFVSLDRFYANLQKNRAFTDESGAMQQAENISMLNIVSALGYEYYFTEHILFYAYTGYTLSNEIRLRNRDQDNVLTINDKNTFYVRSGIKLKI